MGLLPWTGVDGWEEPLFRALNAAGIHPVADLVMVVFTTIGVAYLLPFVSIEVGRRGRHALAFDVLALLALTVVATEVLKGLAGRVRPCEALAGVRLSPLYGCVEAGEPAFPSGHAARAVGLATLFSLGMSRRAGVTMAVVAACIATSRVCLGVHCPTDLLGGVARGVGMAVLLWTVQGRVKAYRDLRSRVVRLLERGTREVPDA